MPERASTAVVMGLADLASRSGDVLGHSSWRVVTQQDVDAFARVTGDGQWIHVDSERAAGGPFRGTVAQGYFTLSLAAAFLHEVLTVEDTGLVLNYGCNRVRFPAPVPVGSRVRAAVELLAVEQAGGGVQATFRLTFEVEGATTPGCVADVVHRYYPAATTPAGGGERGASRRA